MARLAAAGVLAAADTIAGVGASTAADPAKAGRGVGFPFSPGGVFSAGGVPSITPPPGVSTRGHDCGPFGGCAQAAGSPNGWRLVGVPVEVVALALHPASGRPAVALRSASRVLPPAFYTGGHDCRPFGVLAPDFAFCACVFGCGVLTMPG